MRINKTREHYTEKNQKLEKPYINLWAYRNLTTITMCNFDKKFRFFTYLLYIYLHIYY